MLCFNFWYYDIRFNLKSQVLIQIYSEITRDSGVFVDDILNRVLYLIKKNNITRGKFLEDLGLNRSTISDWQNHKSVSYLKYLPQISAYFNVSLDWLAGNEQKNKPSTQESFTDIDAEFLNKIKVLSPETRAQAEKMIDFLLAGQDKKE